MPRGSLPRMGSRAGWAALVFLSGYYLYRAVDYRFLTPGRLGPDLWNKQLWYFVHLGAALPALVGALLGMALVLVWLRLMYDGQSWLVFYVRDPDLRDATREWASWIVPLLGLEMWLSWWPQLRSRSRRRLSVTPVRDRSDLAD